MYELDNTSSLKIKNMLKIVNYSLIINIFVNELELLFLGANTKLRAKRLIDA